jgi:hypothetical protein
MVYHGLVVVWAIKLCFFGFLGWVNACFLMLRLLDVASKAFIAYILYIQLILLPNVFAKGRTKG